MFPTLGVAYPAIFLICAVYGRAAPADSQRSGRSSGQAAAAPAVRPVSAARSRPPSGRVRAKAGTKSGPESPSYQQPAEPRSPTSGLTPLPPTEQPPAAPPQPPQDSDVGAPQDQGPTQQSTPLDGLEAEAPQPEASEAVKTLPEAPTSIPRQPAQGIALQQPPQPTAVVVDLGGQGQIAQPHQQTDASQAMLDAQAPHQGAEEADE